MSIMVRLGVAGDVDGVLACEESPDPGRRAFVESALQSGTCRVAVEGAEIVGYVVTITAHFFDRDFVELLVVSASRRRRGIGRVLSRDVLASSATSDVWTSTNRSNAAMRALLADEGWTFSGEIEGLDDGDPELFFRASKNP